MTQPKLLDTVALLIKLPSDRLSLVEENSLALEELPIGLVGTIVHIYDRDDALCRYLVEFSDSQGREYAMATLQAQDFLVLQYELVTV
ncbi:DUF4926 domain-containing protein [Phormidesmis priestleyi ULC007]|uniref:DUF4926 domain-containing protein n=1 Tax=Phormidesmis priestleyi ULC007 TaxID=1920490 RepID=A0A2T1D804_9CYAN|nr:DUF4926 domain-containing protein [Phormidesmis priestleyi]PSB16623.1 DUF4926 domain-containing protein [Phormidesmis priestleyi ULC007]PZO47527.1 MAG: DUF4926 domain-containing protein [Phormidesmis priestleyi]